MAHATPKNSEGEACAQEVLARELVDCMGRDSAIHICKVNGWMGVLEYLTPGDQKPASSDK